MTSGYLLQHSKTVASFPSSLTDSQHCHHCRSCDHSYHVNSVSSPFVFKRKVQTWGTNISIHFQIRCSNESVTKQHVHYSICSQDSTCPMHRSDLITHKLTLWLISTNSTSVNLQPLVMSACQICSACTHSWFSVNSLSRHCFWSHTQNTAASYYGITLITFHSGYWVPTI